MLLFMWGNFWVSDIESKDYLLKTRKIHGFQIFCNQKYVREKK